MSSIVSDLPQDVFGKPRLFYYPSKFGKYPLRTDFNGINDGILVYPLNNKSTSNERLKKGIYGEQIAEQIPYYTDLKKDSFLNISGRWNYHNEYTTEDEMFNTSDVFYSIDPPVKESTHKTEKVIEEFNQNELVLVNFNFRITYTALPLHHTSTKSTTVRRLQHNSRPSAHASI
jgi:hypothetical protein